MLATVHFIVGAAIGKYVGVWPVALGASLLSHFLLDALPHTDSGTLKEPAERGTIRLMDLILTWLDLTLALAILYWLSKSPAFSASVLAGAVGGIAPDFAHPLYHFLPVLRTFRVTGWYYRLHRRIQGTTTRKNWLSGAVVELIIVVFASIIFLR